MHQTDYSKENEMEGSNKDMDTKLRFNTKTKTQTARGHILHTWDVLLDMGEHGLEVTLPQLAQRACKSQTISSISFGSQGGKSVDVDIITNLAQTVCTARCVTPNQLPRKWVVLEYELINKDLSPPPHHKSGRESLHFMWQGSYHFEKVSKAALC